MNSAGQRSFIKTALPFDRLQPVFKITPNSGAIKAGESAKFSVEFRPTDMRQLKMAAVCRIPNQSTDRVKEKQLFYNCYLVEFFSIL